jgi:catechol 2,3-dioxygenase-like lactoylglutathione lyase family enzyme
MSGMPVLQILSVKIPVTDLTASRRWYADVFGLREEMEWPDDDGVVRGIAFAPLGTVTLALREHPEAAAATRNFGFINVRVPDEDDLSVCAEHLDRLQVWHTPVISGAQGRLVGFRDLDDHELSFYAQTTVGGVRDDSIHAVRIAGDRSVT